VRDAARAGNSYFVQFGPVEISYGKVMLPNGLPMEYADPSQKWIPDENGAGGRYEYSYRRAAVFENRTSLSRQGQKLTLRGLSSNVRLSFWSRISLIASGDAGPPIPFEASTCD